MILFENDKQDEQVAISHSAMPLSFHNRPFPSIFLLRQQTPPTSPQQVSQKQEKTTNSLMTQSSGASIASCCDDSLGDKKIDYTSGTSFANSSTYVHVYDVENRDEAPDDETDSDNAVFRVRHVWLEESDELNDLWTLKRANPVLDSSSSDDENDDEELYESPSKRLRAQKLRWEDEDEDGEPSLIDPARGRMVPS